MAKKLPAMLFFIGDWIKDPKLSLCTPATRGVWIDLLCAMHESGRTGKLCGTSEQLSRTARCSAAELAQALTDLQTTGAADVTERNGTITLINRRMEREHKQREKGTLRQKRFRESPKCNAFVPPIESEIDSPYPKPEGRQNGIPPNPPGEYPTLEQAIQKGPFVGAPAWLCEQWWNRMQGVGWIDGCHRPIRDWGASLRTATMRWEAEGRPEPGLNGHKPYPEQQLRVLQEKVDTHPGNPKNVSYSRSTADQKEDFKVLNGKLSKLKDSIARA